MRIRATPELRKVLISASAVSLAACGVVDEMRGGDDAVVASATATSVPRTDADVVRKILSEADDCLLVVWENQDERDIAFDRRHDNVKGGAISCATGSSASQFEQAIVSIREAAKSGDKARLLREVGIPMMFIDGEGERRALEDPEQVDAVFAEVFDGTTLDMLSRIDLKQMTVVPEQKGGFFELGSLWLVVEEPGARPRIATVNRQAVDEAAEAARAKSEAGDTTPAPLAG